MHRGDEDLEGPHAAVDRRGARDLRPGSPCSSIAPRWSAIVSEEGTRTSHAAILAHSIGIPAVMGLVGRAGARLRPGPMLLLDGSARHRAARSHAGRDRRGATARERPRPRAGRRARARRRACPPSPPTALRVALRGNVDLPEEIDAARAHGAEGVGLMRTEFLVTGPHALPTEDEQAALLRAGRRGVPGPPGRDPHATTWAATSSRPPFQAPPRPTRSSAGARSASASTSPSSSAPQIRAVLRAAADAQIQLMIPLVTRRRRGASARARSWRRRRARLAQEGVARGGVACRSGVMIETPAAAVLADRFAEVERLPERRHQRPDAVHAGRWTAATRGWPIGSRRTTRACCAC